MRPLLLLWLACSGSAPEPVAPEPAVPPSAASSAAAESARSVAPDPKLSPPERQVPSPLARDATPEIDAARAVLRPVVQRHALDPNNPWALSHALVALGLETELEEGVDPIDHLFAEYAILAEVGGETLIDFPQRRGDIRIEPHTDLILKALTEQGASPEREVSVQGQQLPLSALYRHSLYTTWVQGEQLSVADFNDTPWTLQGLAAWAPPGLEWQAEGGREMSMERFTEAVVGALGEDTLFLRQAMSKGERVQKRGQGIFAYTCGGAHLVQGAAYAVARGFGGEEERRIVAQQIPTYLYRMGVELPQVDAAMKQHPQFALVLITQRLKFTGHVVESLHKLAALGFATPGPELEAELRRAEAELLATVQAIDEAGIFDKLGEIRAADEQRYLDLVGDAAHALRGLDLATGSPVRY